MKEVMRDLLVGGVLSCLLKKQGQREGKGNNKKCSA